METQLVPSTEYRCQICRDPRRPEIEAALTMPGASMRAVARQFGYNVQNVQRHRPHLALMLEQARALREVEGLGTLYKRIKTRQEKLMAHAEAAMEKGDSRGAAALFAEARKNDEILLKLGEKPGFRQDGGKTEINAPEARIVVTSLPAPDNRAGS